jgi:PAS domain S-box-containing protein
MYGRKSLYVLGMTALLAGGYFVTAEAGLLFAIPPGNATAVWPPSGIALAALILLGYRFWPGVWVGAFVASATTDVTWVTAAAFASGNTLEAVLGAWACRRFLDCSKPFGRMRDAFLFGLIVATSCTVAATAGAGALVLSGHAPSQAFTANWWTWWMGDVGGCTVLVPLLLALAAYRPVCWNRRRRPECIALILLMAGASQFVFGGWLPERLANGLAYLPMILLFWVLLRFGIVEVSASILLLAAFAITGTLQGTGPFATEQAGYALPDLQVFLNLYAIAGLALAGLVAQGRETEANRGLLAAAVDAAGETILIADSQGTIQYVNPAFERLNEYRSSDVIGRNPRILRSGMTDGSLYVEMWNTIRRGETWRGSFQNRKKDGALYDVEQTVAPVINAQGQVVNYVSVARDVTDRNRAEQALRESLEIQLAINLLLQASHEPTSLKEQLERGLELLLTVPWLAVESKGAVYLAGSESRSLTLAAHRGLPDNLVAVCHTIPFGQCLCGRAASLREVVFAECVDDRHETHYRNMGPHGHYCVPIVSGDVLYGVINLYLKPGHKRDANEERFLNAVANIWGTVIRRKRTEESLQQSEERFALAVRGTDAGIWDWDLRTNRVYFSPRWKSMLGFTEDEIGHTFLEWEQRLHPEDRARAVRTIADYLEGRSSEYELEHRLQHKDGSYRWIVARGAAVRDEKGKPYRMVGSHIDVTSRKVAETSLHATEVALLAAQTIQRRLLPQAPPAVPGLDIAGVCYPAEFTSGDFFDYLELEDESLVLVIADVSGHGFGPALLAATTHAYLRSFMSDWAQIEQTVTRLNNVLCRETEMDRFVTLFLGRIDPRTRSLEYVNAGHVPAHVVDESGSLKATLESASLPLGVRPDERFCIGGRIALAPGDGVVLLTDGILEAASPQGEQFGMDRALNVVLAHCSKPSREVIAALQGAVLEFSQQKSLLDDLTMVVTKVGASLSSGPDAQHRAPCASRVQSVT